MAGIFNCDWFQFSADFDNYDPMTNERLAGLFRHLDQERERENGGFIDLALFNFEVLNHGSRFHYYILTNDDMQIKLARVRSRNKDMYPVSIKFHSQFLWSNLYGLTTLEDKFKFVIEWLEDVFFTQYRCSKISRVDLCYHTDTVPEDIHANNFVGRHTADRTYRAHRRVTGIDIGSRKSNILFLRCYDKYLEVRATKKQWFYDIWLKHDLDVRKVWNIEFQLNREFFTQTKVNTKELESAEDVISSFEALWYYLTMNWVTYRIADTADRRTRWQMHSFWEGVQLYKHNDQLVTRIKQLRLPTVDAIMPGLCGYLSSLAARQGGQLEDGTIFKELYKLIGEYEEKFDKDFLEIVDKKKKLLGNDSEE